MYSAEIKEIFSSLQGEGIYQGVRQIFIRFAGCNLNCDYCDTPEARVIGDGLAPLSRFKRDSGVKVMGRKISGSLSINDLVDLFVHSPFPNPDHLNKIHSVSLTGGEPLLQIDFLEELIPVLKNLGLKIYLETNGTLPEALEKIVDSVDYIAMDIKLPSATGKDLFSEHNKFLQISRNRLQIADCRLQIKIVLTKKTLVEEIKKSIDLIKKISPDIPLVLQPVTTVNGIIPPERKKIFSWFTLAKEDLNDVRIIPQKHKVWEIK